MERTPQTNKDTYTKKRKAQHILKGSPSFSLKVYHIKSEKHNAFEKCLSSLEKLV